MRVFVAVSAALLLFGCNWVVTKAPLFGTADQAGAPQLRAGVWSAGASSDCAFDERRPITDWPDCAGRVVIKEGRWMSLDRKKDGPWTWTTWRPLLTGGTPQILQTPPEATGKGSDGGYSYYGLHAARRDRSGQITAFRMWPVLCGAPAAAAKAGDTAPSSATHAFPGLTRDTSDSDCTTDSRDALRNAADASRLWADAGLTAHWVRAGDR